MFLKDVQDYISDELSEKMEDKLVKVNNSTTHLQQTFVRIRVGHEVWDSVGVIFNNIKENIRYEVLKCQKRETRAVHF